VLESKDGPDEGGDFVGAAAALLLPAQFCLAEGDAAQCKAVLSQHQVHLKLALAAIAILMRNRGD